VRGGGKSENEQPPRQPPNDFCLSVFERQNEQKSFVLL